MKYIIGSPFENLYNGPTCIREIKLKRLEQQSSNSIFWELFLFLYFFTIFQITNIFHK